MKQSMARLDINASAALALSISTLNTLYELKVVTLEQARQTVDNAIRAVAAEDREEVRSTLRATSPAFVR